MITHPSSGHAQDTEPIVEVSRLGSEVALVVLSGEQDMGSAPAVESAVSQALQSCSYLVIDLSAVQFVDSSIINLLVQTKREAGDRGCDFALVLQKARPTERILEICGVLPELNRVTTLDAALARRRQS